MILMRRFRAVIAGCALLGLSLASGPAAALDVRTGPVAVIELFTSPGCSRCPDADQFLAELGARDDVVALGYHIDYWDYTGWADTFGSPQHSELQRAYAQSWGKDRIYTPQMVVNGRRGVVGSHRPEVTAALEGSALPLTVDVALVDEDVVTVSAPGLASEGPAVVWLVAYRQSASVAVERGENEGRALDYSHIVLSRQAVGMWDAARGAEISLPLAEVLGGGADGAAIIIQRKNGELPGPILGAARLER